MSFTQTTSYTPAAYDMDVSMSSDSTSSGSTHALAGMALADVSMASASSMMDVDRDGVPGGGPEDATSTAGASGSGAGRCVHIDVAFAVEAARQSMLKKYKAAVAWGASMSGGRPTKRRKVRNAFSVELCCKTDARIISCLFQNSIHLVAEPNVRYVWYGAS